MKLSKTAKIESTLQRVFFSRSSVFCLTITAFLWGQISYGMSQERWNYLNAEIDTAVKKGNWALAIRHYEELLRDPYNCLDCIGEPFEEGGGEARNAVALSLLYWNTSQRNNAVRSLENAIRIMRSARTLGHGCEIRALMLLKKMRDGSLMCKFSSTDLAIIKEDGYGVLLYVMAPADAASDAFYAKEHERHQTQMARLNALCGMFDSQKQYYQKQGEMQARQATFDAEQEYRRNTGHTFDPARRPVYRGKTQDEWDSCKRIHDIFK